MTRRVAAACCACLALLALGGCGASTYQPAALASRTAGLVDASIGICDALQQLPADVSGAARSFQDEAHAELHVLAATPNLDRGMAARVLEAMAKVESDLALNPTAQPLQGDLQELLSASDTALKALGQTPPECAAAN